jgi:DNA-binding HxlR family transcriptional regulator
MDFIGKRWTLLILLELFKGKGETKRFSELKRSLPDITPKMLSERLRELEVEGLVHHSLDDTVVPPKSMYTLTQSGHEFIEIIGSIKSWALKWKVHNTLCKNLNCRECRL